MTKKLRKIIKKSLLWLIHGPAVQKIMDFGLRNNLAPVLKNIRNLGFSPDLILDVGAYIGEWSEEALTIFASAKGIMFEPQMAKKQQLAAMCQKFSGRLSVQSVLLGDVTGLRDFYRLETGSSIYRENTPMQPIVEKLSMQTLDDSLAGISFTSGTRILLKLDVQGAEKDILLGATRVLENVEVLIMELSFLEYNEGAPLAHEMIAFAGERGFIPFSICGIHRMKGQFVQADVVFVRKSSTLREAAAKSFRVF